MKGEILIEFPLTWNWDLNQMDGIRLVSSPDIKAHFKELGKAVPFYFVGLPYIEINGEQWAVIPIPKGELAKERAINESTPAN